MPGSEYGAQGKFSSVQSLSPLWFFATPWTAARQASLSITDSWSLLRLMSIKLVMPSNHLILCHPLLLQPWIFPNIRVFSNESALCIRWPRYWSFSFNIRPSNEQPGLISFRMDWLDLLVVQGALKSLLQHHSSKTSILWHSGFFIVQLSHPYMTTGKTIALTRQTFVGKVMSLLFNMLSRLVPYGRKWRRTKKSLDESERGEWKSWLKAQHSENEIMASGPTTSWEIDGKTVETVSDFILGGSKITADGDCSHEIKRRLFLGRKVMTIPRES